MPCIVDERICGDTFLRVERISDLEFIVSDIWMYNSNCVFACSTFRQRYEWLHILLSTFTSCIEGLTIDLIHKSDMGDIKIKGYEEYNDEIIGRPGYYVEKDDSQLLNITRMNIPDCYEVEGGGFLKVSTLKASVYLRSKGNKFQCRCIKVDEEFWDIIENIPEVEVNEAKE